MNSTPSEPAVQIAILTGSSRPGHTALSPVQASFLSGLAGSGRALVGWNFPYEPDTEPHREVPLFLAAVRNGAHYLRSRGAGFARRYRPPVQRLLDRAPKTIFLTGSCGLELLLNLELPASDWGRLAVFAYGPVARGLPACPHLLVQGRGDFLSRWAFPHGTHRVDGGHLDYLAVPEVRTLCLEFIGSQEGS